ncbi:MAG TPA: diacylglycerol kinase family protein [Flavisolibacter sp.]|jgi:YegS/Rv2252/BmrU family lipid kinase|nr:diacylglycerol kinase family protein [Flavisolibacter sp.]
MQKLKILFVINPIAGGKEKKDWETAIREFFKDSDCLFDFFIQTGQQDSASVRHHIDRMQPDIVAAVGGDGTVKMVAELIRDTSIKLGIVPAGSANGLAKELGIPVTINEAIDVLMNGVEKKMDAIEINKKELCFHLSDIGLNAFLVKHFQKSKSRGFWGYGRFLLKMLWHKRKMRVVIKTDDGIIKRYAYMVVLANAEKYGTGAVINPEGSVADGKFEIVIVRKIHLFEIFKAITAWKSFHPERIEVVRTKSVALQVHRKTPFQIDGEYMGRINFLEAGIKPAIVTVLVPKASA